jgi:hypothetical protein
MDQEPNPHPLIATPLHGIEQVAKNPITSSSPACMSAILLDPFGGGGADEDE